MRNEKAWEVLSEAGEIFNKQGTEKSVEWILTDAGLSINERKSLVEFARGLYSHLSNRYFMELKASHHTTSDVLWQAIANGRDFYDSINIDVLNTMANNRDYRESFAYVFTEVVERNYDWGKKVAKIVEVSLAVRVVVDENATEDEIIAAVYPKVRERIECHDLGDNIVDIADDEELPYDESYD